MNCLYAVFASVQEVLATGRQGLQGLYNELVSLTVYDPKFSPIEQFLLVALSST